MKKNEDNSLLKILEKHKNCNVKRKILPIILKCEFNMLISLLKDRKTLKIVFKRELHGILGSLKKNNNKDKIREFYIIFSKNKGENISINDLTIDNIENNGSNNIYINNYVYQCSILYNEEWENYKKVLIRCLILNENRQNNQNNQNNITNEAIKNRNEINHENDINAGNFIDLFLSFYLDINNNSTVLLNEIYYDLKEKYFLRFYDVINIFFEKVNKFIEKNFNIYLCNESILINRSMIQIFKYIISLKIFYHKRFIIKDIQKYDDEINIYLDIQDKSYPDSFYRTRLHILKLSEISSFVSIISLIDIKHFNLKTRFLTLKSGIIYVLKTIKKKIEKEIIEN